MSPLDRILPLLAGVKRTAPGRYIALSPTRDERSPSLSIRELDDGTLLLHDFGGSSVEEVVGALGLDLGDLFPQRDPQPGAGRKPERRRFNASDLIALAAFESSIVCLLVRDWLNGAANDLDLDRLIEAARRLGNIAGAVNA
jgi:hypothetical protein